MDAGGRVTAAWCIVTSVKPAKNPNPSGSAAMSTSAASPCKWLLFKAILRQITHSLHCTSVVPKPSKMASLPHGHSDNQVSESVNGYLSNSIKVPVLLSGGWWRSGVPAARRAGSWATRPEPCSACKPSTTAPTGPSTASTAPRNVPRRGEPAITRFAPHSGGRGPGPRWVRGVGSVAMQGLDPSILIMSYNLNSNVIHHVLKWDITVSCLFILPF